MGRAGSSLSKVTLRTSPGGHCSQQHLCGCSLSVLPNAQCLQQRTLCISVAFCKRLCSQTHSTRTQTRSLGPQDGHGPLLSIIPCIIFLKQHLLNCFWQEFLVLTQKETPQNPQPQTSHCLVSVEGGCAAPLVRRTHIVYLSDVNHSHHCMSRGVVLRDQTADHLKTSSVLFSFIHIPLNRVMLSCPPAFSPYLKNKTRQPLVCFAHNLSFSFLTDKRDQPHDPGGKSRNPAAQISKNVFYNSCLGIYIFAPSLPI